VVKHLALDEALGTHDFRRLTGNLDRRDIRGNPQQKGPKMPLELDYYNIHSHEWMLKDSVRCEAFRKAIAEVVTPGCVVLDVGAGSGILSLFAAQAGAGVVYAVERTSIAELAQRIVEKNGFGDRIHVLREDMETIELPGKVDVIVSEWLGGYALDENLLPIVLLARDRWLKPGGRIIPQAVTSYIAPAYDALLQQDIDFWRSDPYGVDLGAIGEARARQAENGRHDLKQGDILCAPQAMWEVDSRTCSVEGANRLFEARLVFTAERGGQFNTLAAWFDAKLSDDVGLCNGPGEPDTHWGRSIFPAGRVVDLTKGARLQIHFAHEPRGTGESLATWEIQVGGYCFRSSDVTALIR
jgi:type I protein arginine methyltransferase